MTDRTFNWRVLDELEKLISESGLTRAEIIQRSGIRRNTFFVKMRGETALTTDDIAKLADALGVAPEIVFLRAVGQTPTDVSAAADDVDLHEVDLDPEEYALAASDDDTAVDPDREIS